ncbi:MAG: right-handed parallel beta-helix repeat-containing protein [Deltaproteobacteria bacterium]|nr:right-handed parallel beta-helix repeat-containing protein [Deltaproteobacteria bacterium]
MARRLRLALSVLGLALVSAVGDCHVAVYVDAANASGVEDGSKAHPYTTIQKAIDQTSIPVAVVIAPGTYAGFTVSARSGLSFQAAGATKPVIDGTALMSTLITITGSTDIELRGLAIQVNQRDAVLVTNGSTATLAGVTIDGPPAPPWPSSPPTCRLVVADPGTAVTIDGSVLTGGRVAVYQLGPSSLVNVRRGSVFSDNYTGVWLLDGANFDIAGSTIEYSSDCGVLGGSNASPGTVNIHSGTSIRWPGRLGIAMNAEMTTTISDSEIQVGTSATALNSQHTGSTVVATDSTFDGGQWGRAGRLVRRVSRAGPLHGEEREPRGFV